MTSSSYWVTQPPEILPSWRVEMPATELPPREGRLYNYLGTDVPGVVHSLFRELPEVEWVIMLPIPEGDGIRFIVGRNTPLPPNSNPEEIGESIAEVILSHYAVPNRWAFWRK